MRLIVFSFIVLLSFTNLTLADTGKAPLKVSVTEKWEVKYTGEGTKFYTIKRIKGESALLMFHIWPVPGNRDQIPYYLNRIADGFLNNEDNNEKSYIKNKDYRKENIEGLEFSGEAVIFTSLAGLYHTIFMISDGDGIWNGQFSGSKERWEEAVIILKQLKRNN